MSEHSHLQIIKSFAYFKPLKQALMVFILIMVNKILNLKGE